MLREVRRLVLVSGLVLALAGTWRASAQVVRVEAVGAVPTREHAPRGIPPRQAALEAGLREAVRAAATRLAEEAGNAVDPASLAEMLGDDPFAYVASFRLLEDRGERPRLLVADPEVEWEYVVVVMAHLDLDRVRERLVQGGLLAPPEPAGEVRTVRVVVEGLAGYPTYRAIRDVLVAHAEAVRPLAFQRTRTLLEVETSQSPGELLQALLAELPPDVQIRPLEVREGDLRLEAVAASAYPRVRALFGARRGTREPAAGD